MPTQGEKLIEGLTGSALWAIPELFGVEPPKEVQQFNAQHPVLGFGTSMVTTAIPYAGWYSATKRIKRLDDLIGAVGANGRPVIGAAAREAARFAPVEVARVAGNAVFGDQSFSDMIGSAALNTALAAGAGAIGGALTAAGRRSRPITEDIPGLDTLDPPQLQLRTLGSLEVPAEVAPRVSAQQVALRDLIRAEDAPDGRYVQNLYRGDSTAINNLFNAREGALTKRATVSRKLTTGRVEEGHFGSEIDWQRALGGAGVNPVDFERYAQYPRILSTKTEAAAKKLDERILQNLEDAGDGWRIGQEVDEGLFVMARKDQKNGRWVMFKTDSPDFFNKKGAQFGSAVVKEHAWVRREADLVKDAGPIIAAGDTWINQVPLKNYTLAHESRGGVASLFDNLKTMSGIQGKLSLADNELVGRLRDNWQRYFTPTSYQTHGSPRATYLIGTARAVKDAADSQANQLMYGTLKADPNKNLIVQSVNAGTNTRTGGIFEKLERLSDDEVAQVWKVYNEAPYSEQLIQKYANGELSENALDTVQSLYKLSDDLGADVNKAETAFGEKASRMRKNYMMMTREWDGDLRIAVRDGGGRLRGIASGRTNAEAEKNLGKMLEANPTWKPAERTNLSDAEIRSPAAGAALPGWARAREGVQGYRYNYQPFTKQELIDGVADQIRQRTQRQADLFIEHRLKGELDRLSIENPQMGRIVAERFGDLQMKQRPLGQIQNKVLDRFLGPILGQNSASRIVASSNKLMWHLELGGLRLGYIIMNALTPIQTVLPEIAYVMNSSPAQLGNSYSHFMAMGSRGPVGTMSVLDPIKFMTGTLKDMRKPDAQQLQMFERALNDRVIDPQIVEEFFGENATKVTDLRKALTSGGGFVSWLEAVSSFLPAQSEKFSRGFAFMAGVRVAKAIGATSDDDIYRFAKQFTTRTGYLYAQADRAAIMTTPAGSFMGLFKNWMMHYMHSMFEYTGEGFARGNWAPLLWQQGSTMALGGLAASPLYNVASAFNNMASNESLMTNAYEMLGQEGADSLFYGLPATFADIALTSQASSPLSNPVRDATMLFSSVHMDRMAYVQKSMGAAMDYYDATGEHPGTSEEVRRLLVRSFAPKTLYRAVQAFGDSGIESLSNGYPILPDAGMYDRLIYAMGLNPTQVDRTYAVADELYNDQEKRRTLVQASGIALKEAIEERNSMEQWRIIQSAIRNGLDVSSVVRSASGRLEAGHQRMLERTFKPENIAKYRAVLGVE